jgi:phosphate starvation-inducible PhoH-like protein
MVSVTGARDELIRVIEKSFSDSVILVRGNEITIDGPKPSVDLIETLISEMLVMLRTGQGLTPESVERSIAMLRSDVRPADVLTANIISSRGRTIRGLRGCRSWCWLGSTIVFVVAGHWKGWVSLQL